MKKTRLLNSFVLARGRDLLRHFLAFFRFTETDACTLLSAYGLHGFEVNRLQNERAHEKKELGETPPGRGTQFMFVRRSRSTRSESLPRLNASLLRVPGPSRQGLRLSWQQIGPQPNRADIIRLFIEE